MLVDDQEGLRINFTYSLFFMNNIYSLEHELSMLITYAKLNGYNIQPYILI